MPYTRRARVLFLAADEKADLAARIAQQFGSTWIEARVAKPIPPSTDRLAWADLVVSLDPYARDHLPQLPPTTRHVHWPVKESHDIETRVKGMLGGMRMLERSHEAVGKS